MAVKDYHMRNIKPGDKFLLPASLIAYDWVNIGPEGGPCVQFKYNLMDLQNIAVTEGVILNPITEISRLRSALKVIRDMLDAPEHRDITPEAIYQIAVKAIDGDDQ